jgi:hypothetical protein
MNEKPESEWEQLFNEIKNLNLSATNYGDNVNNYVDSVDKLTTEITDKLALLTIYINMMINTYKTNSSSLPTTDKDNITTNDNTTQQINEAINAVKEIKQKIEDYNKTSDGIKKLEKLNEINNNLDKVIQEHHIISKDIEEQNNKSDTTNIDTNEKLTNFLKLSNQKQQDMINFIQNYLRPITIKNINTLSDELKEKLKKFNNSSDDTDVTDIFKLMTDQTKGGKLKRKKSRSTR